MEALPRVRDPEGSRQHLQRVVTTRVCTFKYLGCQRFLHTCHLLADSSSLVQTELARIGHHATSSLASPTMPQTLHCVILCSARAARTTSTPTMRKRPKRPAFSPSSSRTFITLTRSRRSRSSTRRRKMTRAYRSAPSTGSARRAWPTQTFPTARSRSRRATRLP